MKRQKALTIAAITVSVLGITALPSVAEISGESILSSFLRPYINQGQQLQSQFLSFFSDFEESLASQAEDWSQQSLDVVMGELGIPDLSQLETQLKEMLEEQNEDVAIDETSNEAVRTVTEGKADDTLSESGQQAVKERLEDIAQTTQELDTTGQEAQTEFVTQNVLKKMALQNVQTGKLMGGLNAQISDLSVKQDLANRNLANISEAVDSQNLARQADADGSGSSVLHLSSMMRMNQ